VFLPAPGEATDLGEFLRAGGTCYLIASERRASVLAPVVSAFADDLIETTALIAAASPGERLDPPLGLFLDEVANIVPLPQLPALMSFAGGTGIFVAGSGAETENRRHGMKGQRCGGIGEAEGCRSVGAAVHERLAYPQLCPGHASDWGQQRVYRGEQHGDRQVPKWRIHLGRPCPARRLGGLARLLPHCTQPR
jgi:hypothetical protein